MNHLVRQHPKGIGSHMVENLLPYFPEGKKSVGEVLQLVSSITEARLEEQ